MSKSDFFQYGEKVDGYDVLVLNEREARAGAGILFAIGILSLTNAVMLHHIIVTKYFLTFFTLDFLIRVIQPAYSPSLLLGRLFVRNQIPEYVGAAQKRFAWGIGLFLAMPMFYMIVINFQANPIKVLICIICLLLLISESAFSFCFGCMIFYLLKKEKATNCPGGACEIQVKDRVQRFDTVQKIIVSLSLLLAVYGGFSYIYKLDNKTILGKHLGKIMMSDADKKALQEKRYEQALKDFDNDDDF
jgi:hypothetical protein